MKKHNRVVGLWPGSSLHARKTLESLRWEDWEYGCGDAEGEGTLGWLGDGWTRADREGYDTVSYLDEVDYLPLPLP